MPCQVIILDTTGTTYTFYEKEKTKEINKKIRKQKEKNQFEREEKKKRKLSWLPAGDVGRHVKKNELNKQHHYMRA